MTKFVKTVLILISEGLRTFSIILSDWLHTVCQMFNSHDIITSATI